MRENSPALSAASDVKGTGTLLWLRLISSPTKADSNMAASLRSIPMKQRRRESVIASRGVREERMTRVEAILGRLFELWWVECFVG